ncbi:MAG: hypothetical protein GY711_28340 [bacterium]|nr:hypothetical protein [bacterium]
MAKKLSAAEQKQFEGMLKHMLAVLSGDIQNLEDEALGNGTDHNNVSAEDSGGEINAMELSLELLEHDEKTVNEVMDALDRVKKGVFGICEACKKPIRKTRLQAVPHARKCIDCQRASEVDMF